MNVAKAQADDKRYNRAVNNLEARSGFSRLPARYIEKFEDAMTKFSLPQFSEMYQELLQSNGALNIDRRYIASNLVDLNNSEGK